MWNVTNLLGNISTVQKISANVPATTNGVVAGVRHDQDVTILSPGQGAVA